MIQVKAQLGAKQTNTFRFWSRGDEVMEGTTYDNAAEFTAALSVDAGASGIMQFLGRRAIIREIAQSFETVYGVKLSLESRIRISASTERQ
ncbi:hypothetical protein PENARI_c003G06624 [Penicillium arizonense]|uniref:NmrA-like domain-containing protein n=1 Tax=Penicillium arizonense TaxID=1835702 RepID=A0A1F5LTN8_PENAI|nr:hypothetical protein PENARI_c003G06624 [Penicillium arizonense]OGE56564.1 hypothetical protein PENARI_c003G06624 [Penicillium arizonense]